MRILRWIDLLANTHLACTLWKWWSTCYCRVLWWTRFWIRGVHTAMRFHIWSHVHKDIWISLIENCIWTDRHPLMQCSNLELYYCACNKIKQKKWLDIPKKNASINHWNFQMKIQRMLLSFTNHIKGTNTTFRIPVKFILYNGSLCILDLEIYKRLPQKLGWTFHGKYPDTTVFVKNLNLLTSFEWWYKKVISEPKIEIEKQILPEPNQDSTFFPYTISI